MPFLKGDPAGTCGVKVIFKALFKALTVCFFIQNHECFNRRPFVALWGSKRNSETMQGGLIISVTWRWFRLMTNRCMSTTRHQSQQNHFFLRYGFPTGMNWGRMEDQERGSSCIFKWIHRRIYLRSKILIYFVKCRNSKISSTNPRSRKMPLQSYHIALWSLRLSL